MALSDCGPWVIWWNEIVRQKASTGEEGLPSIRRYVNVTFVPGIMRSHISIGIQMKRGALVQKETRDTEQTFVYKELDKDGALWIWNTNSGIDMSLPGGHVHHKRSVTFICIADPIQSVGTKSTVHLDFPREIR